MATSIKSHTVTGVGCIALILFTYMIFGPQTKLQVFNNNIAKYHQLDVKPINATPSLRHTDRHLNWTKSEVKTKTVSKLVYIKIGKTGSTTLNYMFTSFAYRHQWPLILHRTKGEIDTLDMNPGNTWDVAPTRDLPPAMISAHTRYNRMFFNKHFPDNVTFYVTSIREPISWFVSYIDYRNRNAKKKQTPRQVLTSDRIFHQQAFTAKRLEKLYHNYFLQYLGFHMGAKYRYNEEDILEYIKKVESKFDLVIITEYTAESLVLLKRLLGWSMKDIFFVRRNSGTYHSNTIFTEEKRRKLLDSEHNRGDWLLYQHFNRTFWKRVAREQYFFEEVEEFLHLNKLAEEFCNEPITEENREALCLSSRWESDIVLDEEYCISLQPMTLFKKIRTDYAPFYRAFTQTNTPRVRFKTWPGLT